MLTSSTGRTATLGSLATITELPGQTEILQDDLQRYVAVTARLEGLSLGDGVAAAQQAVDALGLPAQIRIAGGEGASDTLFLQALGGDDEVTVAPAVSDLIAPVVNLGADE